MSGLLNDELGDRMNTQRLAMVLLLSSTFISCSSKEARSLEMTGERYKVLSAQKYGGGAEWITNAAKTAVLCLKRAKPTAQLPQHRVSFFIFDVVADRVVFEDDVPNGSVSWKDDQSVIVETVPGIEEKKDDVSPPARHGYLVDIRTGKTRELKSAVVR
ncbi:MAG TPA: hypothetical protein DEP53_19005 [Bacteroidetes bacterium]|nr:hypothetical protein [Bacteroidota bacterium]